MSLPPIPSYELERIEDECRAAGVYAEYAAMVARGEYPRAAAMFALQSPAGSRNTDRAFCEGARRQMDGMLPLNQKKVLAAARAAGISVDGKFYKGSLGRPNDPAAWVTCADDVLAVCKARNLDCQGVITHKAHFEDRPAKKTPLAPDIVKTFERDYMAKNPALAAEAKKNPKVRKELRERIVATHGAKARKTR
jgi:hypothetical protein